MLDLLISENPGIKQCISALEAGFDQIVSNSCHQVTYSTLICSGSISNKRPKSHTADGGGGGGGGHCLFEGSYPLPKFCPHFSGMSTLAFSLSDPCFWELQTINRPLKSYFLNEGFCTQSCKSNSFITLSISYKQHHVFLYKTE